MTQDNNCIFCKIANGDMASEMVYESEHVAAFRDVNPQAPVHVLVVPKEHYANVIDGVPAHVLADMIEAVGELAKRLDIADSGFRLIANTGQDAGQTVNHLHFHVLGGKKLDEKLI